MMIFLICNHRYSKTIENFQEKALDTCGKYKSLAGGMRWNWNIQCGLYGNDNGKAINSYEINYLVLWAKKIIELRTNSYAKTLFP